MGLTQKLGLLAQGVVSDSSLNIGVGAAPSGSYKFEVTGTAKVSNTLLVVGQLTLNSTITNGTYVYTLPAASGTIALVGQLSAYVPYTGATGPVNLGAYNLTLKGITVGAGLSNPTLASPATILGYEAGLSFTIDENENTAIGYKALRALAIGFANTAVGSMAMTSAVSYAEYNTAVGADALWRLTTGNDNTAIGYSALDDVTTGSRNIAIGYTSGQQIVTGSGNIMIGYQSTAGADVSNYIVIRSGAGVKAQHDGTNWTFTGGTTLTGALNGTSATFSANVADYVLKVTNTGGATSGYQGLYVETSTASTAKIINAVVSGVSKLYVDGTGATVLGGSLTGTSATFNGNVGVNASSFTSSTFYTNLLVKSPTSADAGITVNGGTGSSYLYLTHDLTGTLPFLEIGEYNGSMQILHYNGTQNSRPIAYNGTSKILTFQTDGTNRITVFNTGNTFIGSFPTDAGYKLDVNGTGRFSGAITGTSATFNSLAGTGTRMVIADSTGLLSTQANIVITSGTAAPTGGNNGDIYLQYT